MSKVIKPGSSIGLTGESLEEYIGNVASIKESFDIDGVKLLVSSRLEAFE